MTKVEFTLPIDTITDTIRQEAENKASVKKIPDFFFNLVNKM
jgi:hypothetical protein